MGLGTRSELKKPIADSESGVYRNVCLAGIAKRSSVIHARYGGRCPVSRITIITITFRPSIGRSAPLRRNPMKEGRRQSG